MRTKRWFRWLLFLGAAASFLRVVWAGAEPFSVGTFFVLGGGWFWLERRKTRELDAPRPR